jgi:hypothetical protein
MTVSHILAPATRLKSPTCGGFRGPTPAQPHSHQHATRTKSPQHWGDLGGLTQHSEERKRKSQNRKTNLLSPP